MRTLSVPCPDCFFPVWDCTIPANCSSNGQCATDSGGSSVTYCSCDAGFGGEVCEDLVQSKKCSLCLVRFSMRIGVFILHYIIINKCSDVLYDNISKKYVVRKVVHTNSAGLLERRETHIHKISLVQLNQQ